MRTHLLAVGLFALVGLACSSTSSGSGGGSGLVTIDTASVCGRLINECHQTISQAQCEQTFGIVRVSQACVDKFNSATCEEIGQTGSDFDETCFPNCDAKGTQTCNGDGTVTICSDEGRTLIGDCAATCQKILNKSYSGTCGKSFGGQTSDKDKCWCQ